jgi:hypothetical protein
MERSLLWRGKHSLALYSQPVRKEFSTLHAKISAHMACVNELVSLKRAAGCGRVPKFFKAPLPTIV